MMYEIKFTKLELEAIEDAIIRARGSYPVREYYAFRCSVDHVMEKIDKVNKEFRLWGKWRIPYGKKDK